MEIKEKPAVAVERRRHSQMWEGTSERYGLNGERVLYTHAGSPTSVSWMWTLSSRNAEGTTEHLCATQEIAKLIAALRVPPDVHGEIAEMARAIQAAASAWEAQVLRSEILPQSEL